MGHTGAHARPVGWDQAPPALTTRQLVDVLGLLPQVDSVELKVSVSDSGQRSAVMALDLDPIEAEIRQVAFFDTPALALDRAGLVVRVRRIQRSSADVIVKLRPVDPSRLDPTVRQAPGFGVEIDAVPGGYVCSATMKSRIDNRTVQDVIAGRERLRHLLTKRQRAFFSAHAPAGVRLDHLAVLGPVLALRLKFKPAAFGRRLVAELWTYPDGSRLLELSTTCKPGSAFAAAAEMKAFLALRGIGLLATHHTKTRSALEFFTTRPTGLPDPNAG